MRGVMNATLACLGGVVLLTPMAPFPATGTQSLGWISTLDGRDCEVEPRTIAEILALHESPPRDGSWIQPLPTGTPAGPDMREEINALVREIEACMNAGDLLRYLALFSDDWLRLPIDVETATAELAAKTPTPVPEGRRAAYIGPWHVEILDDGRVLAAVLPTFEDEPNPDPSRTQVWLFIKHDGRWLVDELIDNVLVTDCEHSVAVETVVGPPPGLMLDSWPVSCDSSVSGRVSATHSKAGNLPGFGTQTRRD